MPSSFQLQHPDRISDMGELLDYLEELDRLANLKWLATSDDPICPVGTSWRVIFRDVLVSSFPRLVSHIRSSLVEIDGDG